MSAEETVSFTVALAYALGAIVVSLLSAATDLTAGRGWKRELAAMLVVMLSGAALLWLIMDWAKGLVA